ncbi:DEAD/DEAH box helicase [Arsenicicoccus piscis]|uniref:Helicase n=1 Tax=Arsenicicoccus piscis TaxID=673954 RepID=A0ABQ6HU16_9MICO|nr:DEAD/DEAH box helicase [Arsenicicoccus piscis]MCH8628392.1 DEAD/DEAH box helicase [Arsenicicoccus piscis]GMA19722.1 helicase [Arsenicicoccus piscis]GMA22016.1 helicase [Arsenicicoccus piscis]
MGPHLTAFAEAMPFPLDEFQILGCEAVEDGRGVLVAAPTGAGKTVVGEFGVHLALQTGRKAFYTTPIKALSNQKYHDLVRRHGADQVGLLTGDASINGDAPVVVMTTEVLRNMLYGSSTTLGGLGFVVMDEVHYLADRFRGAVWEEVIIHLPEHVQVISLSATVSNAEEFGAWLSAVRGNTTVVVSEDRPVPLWQHMMVGRDLFDLFVDDGLGILAEHGDAPAGQSVQVNPELLDRIREVDHFRHSRGYDRSPSFDRRGRERSRGGRGGDRGDRGDRGGDRPAGRPAGAGGGRPGGAATRAEVIARLEREGLLPAITFIFSRAGCEAAVGQLLAQDVRLISPTEGARNRRRAEERLAGVDLRDLGVLGYHDFVEGLSRGFAAHHAGMLPTFREIVEELFTEGRVQAVFATETLALGINMPARTVVLEKLVKFNGDSHVDLTPAEYTQLTGRAGRRGIDIEGHAVVVWSRGLDPVAVGGLASTRTYPLNSSFRPTYNMAVNLVDRVGRDAAREILQSSFAQFQADRGAVGLAAQLKRQEEGLEGYAQAMECHLGDFPEYARIRGELSHAEKEAAKDRQTARRADIEASLSALKPGDVVVVPDGRREGMAVVIGANKGGRQAPVSPAILDSDGRVRRLTTHDVRAAVTPVTRLDLPRSFNPKNAKSRRDLAATMRAKVPFEPPRGRESSAETAPAPAGAGPRAALKAQQRRIDELRRELKAHPCHQCPDREHHARWAERWWKAEREARRLRRAMDQRTNSVARQFDQICSLLSDLGYLNPAGTEVTPAGRLLQRIYTEKDLLTAECLNHALWARLDAPSLAAVVSALVHEPRGREDGSAEPRLPNEDVAEAFRQMVRLWSTIEDLEDARKLPSTGAPESGMLWMTHRWAAGQSLDVVLRDSDMAAGDFVRRCKQIVDLLGQIAVSAPQPALQATARRAMDAVNRGVVAADQLD